MYETAELGPILHERVPDFQVIDHLKQSFSLNDLLGEAGVLLGFTGDIWQPASVRRILWLQRHAEKMTMLGAPVALLVQDYHHTLYGFHMSSPLPVPFPLLADPEGEIHRAYHMDRHPGLLLIDRQHVLREKWLMPTERVWPKVQELVQGVQELLIRA